MEKSSGSIENKTYSSDIEGYWGELWKNTRQPFDFQNKVAVFKFSNFIKPVLDRLPHSASICEVGVGLGNWLFLAKSYRPDLKLFGADLSQFSVNYCNENGIDCVKADTRSLPFPDKNFDAVFSWGVVEHMEDSNAAVKEQLRISKKWLVFDVPFGQSLAHLSTKRAVKRRSLTKYEFMIEFGRFFDRASFYELLRSSTDAECRITVANNFLVLPGRFNKFEKIIPNLVRRYCGSNIGAIVEKT